MGQGEKKKIHSYTYVDVCGYIYMHKYICMYIYIHIHTYIYTHIHTHTPLMCIIDWISFLSFCLTLSISLMLASGLWWGWYPRSCVTGSSPLQYKTGHQLWHSLAAGDVVLAVNVSTPIRKDGRNQFDVNACVMSVTMEFCFVRSQFSDAFTYIEPAKKLLNYRKEKMLSYCLDLIEKQRQRERETDTEWDAEGKRYSLEPNILKHSREK